MKYWFIGRFCQYFTLAKYQIQWGITFNHKFEISNHIIIIVWHKKKKNVLQVSVSVQCIAFFAMTSPLDEMENWSDLLCSASTDTPLTSSLLLQSFAGGVEGHCDFVGSVDRDLKPVGPCQLLGNGGCPNRQCAVYCWSFPSLWVTDWYFQKY